MKRKWQCGTIQLDFMIPKTLNAIYLNKYSKKQTPIMLHRAILGSLERFIGLLIENYNGKLPIWLSPIQIIVIGISNIYDKYIKTINQKLITLKFRSSIDLRNKKINFKIREHSLMKIPFLIIIGKKEKLLQTITIRTQTGINLGRISQNNFFDLLNSKISQKK
jgi:threonyl-tRNA synthetase